ncbi:MAG: DUF1127 domain-containing protein [Proteobacteria bacterium]|nr:DUF1127 domain-containing protein [Pseudomonadota bacterium]
MAFAPGVLTVSLLALASATRRVIRALAHRRSAMRLADWDQHTLDDIGLTRRDVRLALGTSLLSDPTVTLSLIAAERQPSARQDSASRPAMPSGRGAAGRSRPGTLPSAGPVVYS